VSVVDHLRGGVRQVIKLPKRAGRGIRSGARDLSSVPRWVGRGAGSTGRAVGRTVTGLPSRASGLVRGSTPEASAARPSDGAGDGMVERARDNPRFALTIAGGGLLLIAWIGWAVYVTSAHGARAGLGVVLSWPVLLGALVLITLPFIGVYLLIRRLQEGGSETGTTETPAAEDEEVEEEAEDGDDSEGDEDDDGDSEADDGDSEDDDAESEDDDGESSDEDTDTTAKAGASG
jgi:hypothetical protein